MLKSRFIVNVPKYIKRDLSTNIPALQKATDPIQKLFLDKLREYKTKNVDGKLVDASPEILNELKSNMEKLNVQYGSKGENLSQFPQFKFAEPHVDTGIEKK